MRRVRIGIDVGGTFTKAVAVDALSFELIGQAVVPTTHGADEGVAAGVVAALHRLLERYTIAPEEVALVAHSTTQAVNALLEGDTATVGILGMGRGDDVLEAARRTRVDTITLAPGKALRTLHLFIDTTHGLPPETAQAAVARLVDQGAQAIVASEAFSVEDPRHEQTVLAVAAEMGIPAVAAHQLTGAYGLEVRTVTAAINAALLPRMLETAILVEESLRRSGLHAPLMVMRGDGGLADIETMRQRPILTLFSGPSASLAGALLAGHVVFAAFLEVGGTSSNISLIRHGMPTLQHVRVMSHPTCVQALDVRVQGVAGGSMIRLGTRGPQDVGPRSAHIAGLPYACFDPRLADAEQLRIETVAPTPGDPDDYAVLADGEGNRWALTLTCAANALGLVPPNAYARGDRPAAQRAFQVLGHHWGIPGEEAARRVLNRAADRVAEAILLLVREYQVPRDRLVLVGGGGGAGALVPAVAERLEAPYRLVPHAEVISSLGDALASVREVVERPRGTGENAQELARAARAAAVRAGAAPDSISVTVEQDEERGVIRAVATGHAALMAPAQAARLSPQEAQRIAAEGLGVAVERLQQVVNSDTFHVFRAPRRWLRGPRLAVVDVRGAVRTCSGNTQVLAGTPSQVLQQVTEALAGNILWRELPDVQLLVDGQWIHVSQPEATNSQLLDTLRTMLESLDEQEVIAIVGG